MKSSQESLPNHYRVLNIEPTASRLEVREAYLRLKHTYSAGSAALYSLIGHEDANAELEKVEEAFRILGDDYARQAFDRGFFGATARSGASFQKADQRNSYSDQGTPEGEDRYRLQGQWEETPAVEDALEASFLERDSSVVRTTRSTLPIIKLKVQASDEEELQVTYRQMIEASQPGDGDLFRRLREAAGVSEHEMQERIKVSIGYLKAIEGNRFERLPQAVYVKGFLRSYFRYLGVPQADRFVQAFAARLQDWQTHKKT